MAKGGPGEVGTVADAAPESFTPTCARYPTRISLVLHQLGVGTSPLYTRGSTQGKEPMFLYPTQW